MLSPLITAVVPRIQSALFGDRASRAERHRFFDGGAPECPCHARSQGSKSAARYWVSSKISSTP